MKCFYHHDSDGKCAGYWVNRLAVITDEYQDKMFVKVDYKDKFPLEMVRKNEQVFIVDYSIPPPLMLELLMITKNVTWIDHHKTAIEKYGDFEHELRGFRYVGHSGAMLTYCYLKFMTDGGTGEVFDFNPEMTERAPLFTILIDDWDVWRLQYGSMTKDFQLGFNSYNFEPTSDEWKKFSGNTNSHEHKLIEEGIIINRYRAEWAKNYMAYGFELEFEGKKTFAINLGLCNSEYFKSLETSYDMLMPFVYDGKKFNVSLYSTKIDVSKIAKKYGGGGHAGASGFQCKKLPFKTNF